MLKQVHDMLELAPLHALPYGEALVMQLVPKLFIHSLQFYILLNNSKL